MTNEIIQAIREEIARLQPNAPKPGNMKSVDAKVAMQVHARLNKLLSFISYLEKSLPAKVADDDDKVLEVEAVSYCFDNGLNITPRVAADFARHFYDLGCRRTAEKYDELEYNRQRAEESPLPEDTVLFNKGVEEGKRLMMEEAVEGEVMDFCFVREVNYSRAAIEFVRIPRLQEGDKVIVIVKKED